MSEDFRSLVDSTGLKAVKIAEICNVSPNTVSIWLSGRREPPALLVKKLREIDRIVNS